MEIFAEVDPFAFKFLTFIGSYDSDLEEILNLRVAAMSDFALNLLVALVGPSSATVS